MDDKLWPASQVAEFVYCPRLFYFQQVENISLSSADMERGRAFHRRVDQPGRPPAEDGPEDDNWPQTVRSLALSSPALGLTATLDLAEISGGRAAPVEYRVGRPRRLAAEDGSETPRPWPTDRVQVGLQVLLLEAAGYEVPEAFIYYGAEKCKLAVPADDALRAEALAALAGAKQCAEGERPEPLLNDPRCPRCSLGPICLPDEINQQRGPAPNQPAPRRLWPPLSDGLQVIAQSEGIKIGVRGRELRASDGRGAVVKTLPLVSLESLALLGAVQISSQAVRVLADLGIPLAFLSPAGRLVAMVDPLDSVSAVVRRWQVRRFDRREKCLELARALVTAKIANQRTFLRRNHGDLPGQVVDDLAAEARQAAGAETLESLRGHEGRAAALYFRHFSGLFQGDLAAGFAAVGRQRRPPPDPVNACLSLAYTMLTHECVAALRLARLEPAIGAYHVSSPGRPALALDLMEPFRPLIADSLAITCFNRQELTAGHFLRTAAGCALTEAGRAAFFGAWGRRLDTTVTHPVFNYRLSYRRMIQLHARMIAAWVTGDLAGLDFLTTR
jgi:CRISPR-associated endonuclease Cas1/CRISPR-associated protein Cas4